MNNNKENYKNAMNQIHPNEKLKSDTIEKMIQKKIYKICNSMCSICNMCINRSILCKR